MAKRLACLKQFGAFLVDVPHVLMGLVVLLTLWRAPLLVRQLRKADDVDEAREAAAEQCAFLLRDLPCFGLFALLGATLYRLPNVLLKLRAATKTSLLNSDDRGGPQLLDVTVGASLDAKGVVRLLVRGATPGEIATRPR